MTLRQPVVVVVIVVGESVTVRGRGSLSMQFEPGSVQVVAVRTRCGLSPSNCNGLRTMTSQVRREESPVAESEQVYVRVEVPSASVETVLGETVTGSILYGDEELSILA